MNRLQLLLFVLYLLFMAAAIHFRGQMHYDVGVAMAVGAVIAVGAFVGSLAGSNLGARRGDKNPVVPTLIGAVVGAFAIPVGVAAIFIAVAFLVTWISGTRQ